MIRKLIFTLLACISFNFSNGQGNAFSTCDSLYSQITEPKLIGDLLLYQATGKGSQFFIDDWLDGTILLSNNIRVKNKNLRYNGYLDGLIWQTKFYQQVRIDKESVKEFTLDDKASGARYTFQKIKIKEEFIPDSVIIYAQLLYSSPLSLYAYRKVVMTGTEDLRDGSSRSTKIYQKKPVYFFTYANHTFSGFKRISRRNVLNLFPDRKEQVISLLAQAKLRRFRTEEELTQVAEVLNRLNWQGKGAGDR